MKISIIHPSRSRALLASKTASKWLTSARDRFNIQYIVSLDTTDETIQHYKELMPSYVEYHIADNKTAIQAINNAARQVSNDLIVVVSDDFDCPAHWDEGLLKHLSDKSDFVVKTIDGGQPWIITLPIMDKMYYNRFGYIYPPHIQHMFADTWMTAVGDLLDKKITVPITFRHLHYTTGVNAKDAINEKNDSTWHQGETEYLKGLRNNFGLKEDEIKGALRCDSSHVAWLRSKGVNFELV